MSEKHTVEEIHRMIEEADVVHVSTLSGTSIRSRVMHFGLGEGFDIYLASMKGDPKTVQLSNNPNITLLFSRKTADESNSAEVEVSGIAEPVREEEERKKGFALEARKSSIVRSLIESDNSRALDCIKVRPIQVRFRVFREIMQGVPPTVYDFPQNMKAESDWRLLRRKAKLWAIEVRAPFLTGSVIPVVLGAMIAFTDRGMFDWGLFVLALLGGVFMHLGTNVFNDYFDHRSLDDEVNKEFVRPFSGGSRMIQLGLMTPLEVLAEAIVLFSAAAFIGLYLAWARGWPILALGAIGLISGYFYTAPPLNIAARGIGELVVGINFGVLMTLGSYYVQTLTLSWAALVASIPPALLIAAVLYINEFPDYKADMAVGKRHLVVRLGREKAMLGVPALFAGTYATIVLGVIIGILPIYTLISLFAVPFGIKASLYSRKYHSRSFELAPANAATILAHMFTGILLIVGFGLTELETAGLAYVAIVVAVLAALVTLAYWGGQRKEVAMAEVRKTMA